MASVSARTSYALARISTVSEPLPSSIIAWVVGPITNEPTMITVRISTSLAVTHGYRSTPHLEPSPSTMPLISEMKLSGMPKTRLNMLSSS